MNSTKKFSRPTCGTCNSRAARYVLDSNGLVRTFVAATHCRTCARAEVSK